MTCIPDSSDLTALSGLVGTLTPSTPTQLADARAYVTAHAHDGGDLADLLAAIFGEAA